VEEADLAGSVEAAAAEAEQEVPGRMTVDG